MIMVQALERWRSVGLCGRRQYTLGNDFAKEAQDHLQKAVS